MQGQRGQPKNGPQQASHPVNPADVPDTQDSDIQPDTLLVEPVDFRPGRRRQALHAVVTRSEEHRAHDIDQEVDARVESSRCIAAPLKQGSPARMEWSLGGDDGDYEVEPEDGERRDTA